MSAHHRVKCLLTISEMRIYLTEGEIEKTGAMLRTPIATDRAWDYYAARSGFQGL
jgi:hypothetical protein